MIHTKKADLLTEPLDAIIHSCNCFHVHGGLAGAVARKYPAAAVVDMSTDLGDKKKLGTCSIARDNFMTIVNLYGQFEPGPTTDPNAILSGLVEARMKLSAINNKFEDKIKTIGIPYMMGCGIGGGDWKQIEPMIEFVFIDSPFDVIICKKDA